MSEYVTWIVGRGLLGRHVEVALQRAREEVWRAGRAIPWESPSVADALGGEAEAFFASVRHSGQRWRILWTAGRSGVATSADSLSRETTVFRGFLGACAANIGELPDRLRPGVVMFASSAGALYWKSSVPPPYDEDSPVEPDSAYGREKLSQERLLGDFSNLLNVDALIGRFSNLYGPGQDVSKPQGLVAHVGWAALCRVPVSIYVPLDTIRDYLFAPDAGRMVMAALEARHRECRRGEAVGVITKIFAAEVPTSVASVLGTWRQTMRQPIRIAFGSSLTTSHQPHVLSFRSRVWPDIRGQPTRLPLGIEIVHRDQLALLRRFGASRRAGEFHVG